MQCGAGTQPSVCNTVTFCEDCGGEGDSCCKFGEPCNGDLKCVEDAFRLFSECRACGGLDQNPCSDGALQFHFTCCALQYWRRLCLSQLQRDTYEGADMFCSMWHNCSLRDSESNIHMHQCLRWRGCACHCLFGDTSKYLQTCAGSPACTGDLVVRPVFVFAGRGSFTEERCVARPACGTTNGIECCTEGPPCSASEAGLFEEGNLDAFFPRTCVDGTCQACGTAGFPPCDGAPASSCSCWNVRRGLLSVPAS